MGLLSAAYIGHTSCLEDFIEAGADVNCRDESFDIIILLERYYNTVGKRNQCEHGARI